MICLGILIGYFITICLATMIFAWAVDDDFWETLKYSTLLTAPFMLPITIITLVEIL